MKTGVKYTNNNVLNIHLAISTQICPVSNEKTATLRDAWLEISVLQKLNHEITFLLQLAWHLFEIADISIQALYFVFKCNSDGFL